MEKVSLHFQMSWMVYMSLGLGYTWKCQLQVTVLHLTPQGRSRFPRTEIRHSQQTLTKCLLGAKHCAGMVLAWALLLWGLLSLPLRRPQIDPEKFTKGSPSSDLTPNPTSAVSAIFCRGNSSLTNPTCTPNSCLHRKMC